MELLDLISRLQTKELKVGYGAFVREELIVLDVAALEADVNNGGFHQFFFNSASDRVRAMIEALKLIGAANAALVVEDACRVFPAQGPSSDRDARQEQLDQIDEDAFEALDERFYAYPDPLEALLEAFCRKSGLLP